jgi:single-strand DNA-binding protein
MNKAVLMGRLGGDPEVRYISGGETSVTRFSVATSEKWTSKSGEKQERTDWHRCDAWGKTGELIAEYLGKGDQILLEGRIRVDQYERDGEKRTGVSIRVDRFHFVGSKGDSSGSGESKPRGRQGAPKGDDGDDWDSDDGGW